MTDPTPLSVTRRQLLGGAAVAGLAAIPVLSSKPALASTTARPSNAAQARAAAALAGMTGSLSDVEHVVFVMMENRSFDHVYGTLSGVRGFDDRSVTLPGGGNIFAQPDVKSAKGFELPFRLATMTNNGQHTPSLDHGWSAQHLSRNDGSMDGWIAAHRSADGDTNGVLTMGYYDRSDLPYHFALADAFTVMDHYHCSVLGPTYPNRLMWQAGSIDAEGKGGGPLVTTDEGVFTGNTGKGVFSFETYPERLSKAGVEWACYADATSNHLYNMLPSFKQFGVPGTDLYNRAQGVTAPWGTLLKDAASGNLPAVSWAFPRADNSEHPALGSPNSGPNFYQPLIEALMRSPKWKNTVLFLTWDENDGYFDHVAPPVAPPGTKGEYLQGPVFGKTATKDPAAGISGPVGLGFRVPTIVVSPFARGGYVNSEVSDHTSGLLFLEKRFGVEVTNLSDWRRSTVGDFTSTMDFTRPDTSVPDLTAAFLASQAAQTPTSTSGPVVPGSQTMPTQEKGTRPRRGPVPAYVTAKQAPAKLTPSSRLPGAR